MKKFDFTRQEATRDLIRAQMSMYSAHIAGILFVMSVLSAFYTANASYVMVAIAVVGALIFSYRAAEHKVRSAVIRVSLEEDTFKDD